MFSPSIQVINISSNFFEGALPDFTKAGATLLGIDVSFNAFDGQFLCVSLYVHLTQDPSQTHSVATQICCL